MEIPFEIQADPEQVTVTLRQAGKEPTSILVPRYVWDSCKLGEFFQALEEVLRDK